jgi:hypothetical protein
VRRLVLAGALVVLFFLSGCFPVGEPVYYEPGYYDPGYYVPYGSLDTFLVQMYNDCQYDTPAIDVYLDGAYQLTVYDYNALYMPRGNYYFYVEGQQSVLVDPEMGYYEYYTYADEGTLYVDGDIDWTVCEYY